MLLISLECALALTIGGVQDQITVGSNVQVSAARATLIHDEVTIAADPTNSRQLLAASMTIKGLAVYRSSDGGKNWELALEKRPVTTGEFGDPALSASFGDPAVAYGPDGFAYFAFLFLRSSIRPIQLEVVRSPDGGKTWQTPTKMEGGGSADRPFLVVDGTQGKLRGRVYAHCTLVTARERKLAFSTSSDAGKTFTPLRTWATKNGHMRYDGQGAVLSDGTLVIPYAIHTVTSSKKVHFEIRMRRSMNGGESFLDEQCAATEDIYRGAYESMPMVAADSGTAAFKKHLYLSWSQMTDTCQRVLFALSKDKGVTWSKPIVLSEQTAGNDYHAVLPAVAVNRGGIVAVSWYDSRDGQAGKPSCHVRLRASVDGGTTWLPSVRVTDVASSVDLGKPVRTLTDDYSLLGDTAGLCADGAGDFHPAWADKRTGILQLFTATVSVREKSRR